MTTQDNKRKYRAIHDFKKRGSYWTIQVYTYIQAHKRTYRTSADHTIQDHTGQDSTGPHMTNHSRPYRTIQDHNEPY